MVKTYYFKVLTRIPAQIYSTNSQHATSFAGESKHQQKNQSEKHRANPDSIKLLSESISGRGGFKPKRKGVPLQTLFFSILLRMLTLFQQLCSKQ